MIIDSREYENVLNFVRGFQDYARAKSSNNDIFLNDETMRMILSDSEEVLYEQYFKIILNVQILSARGYSDEKLERVISFDKRTLEYTGNLEVAIRLKACESELQRRRENIKIDDIDVDIPFYFKNEFNIEEYSGEFTDEQLNELMSVISFLISKSKYNKTINGETGILYSHEDKVFKKITMALSKSTGLSIEDIVENAIFEENTIKNNTL